MAKRGKPRNKAAAKKIATLKKNQKRVVDTALDLLEVYESVERSYRAAAMAGTPQTGVAYSTNY